MDAMECENCGETFSDGIEAGNHEIATGHRVTWAKAARPRFTDQTWKALGNRGLTREVAPRDWTRQHDLALEAEERTADFCSLSHQEWETLITAVASGLPVVLTLKRGAETTTNTFMVDQIISLGAGTTANLYVRTWGFSHPVSLSELVSVKAPEASHEFDVKDWTTSYDNLGA